MATNMISALGAGSGVDVKALAQSLVDAEKVPREDAINAKIDKQDRKVAGYSAMMLSLQTLKASFQKLNDKTDFSAAQATSSNTSAVTASASALATPGRHSVEVLQLASAQHSAMGSFATTSDPINGSQAFDITLSIGGVAQTAIEVATATPQGVVDAINTADQGVTAQLIDTGDGATPYRIVLSGPMGADGTFSLSAADSAGASVAELDLDPSNLQTASDALVKVNGLTLTRSSNAVDDAIPGVYIDLSATNVGEPLSLQITRDTTSIVGNVQSLVESYNAAVSDFDILTGEKSDDAEDIYSGSLAGDSLVQRVKSQLRSMFLSDSSTPSGDISAMRDIGLDIDRYGVLSVDETKLNAALTNNFDDVVTMLSADTSNQSEYGDASRGLAGDAVKSLNDLISTRGSISEQSTNATNRVDEYQADLEKLNTRMEALLARYTKQFGIMESMVGQTNSMRDSLKSTFEGMMAVYTK